MTKIIKIGGMSCGHCSARVEKALSALGDIKVSVDLKAGTATVESENILDDAPLRGADEDLGFDCLSIENA